MLESQKSLKVYYVICIGIIIVSVVIISITAFRYEKTFVGRWDLRYDRFDGAVYMKHAFRPEAQWKKSRFKSLRQAQFILEQRLREEAAEDAMSDMQDKLDEIREQQDDMVPYR